ncbi:MULTISPECIES: hypothetical protein [unclassified Arthrobacter]|uniref:hypothetical protein n=1 Tax=unclassified Arthrobacter TaxID=235627 RepID=UPI00339B0196
MRRLTLTDVNELFDVRLCLKTFAARTASVRVAEGQSLKPLFGRMRWIFGLAHNRSNELQRDEHVEFCGAILKGRPDLAYSLVYSHIELGREPVLAGLAHTLAP